MLAKCIDLVIFRDRENIDKNLKAKFKGHQS